MTCNSLLHLLSHPAQLGLVSADPGLLPDAVAESLRLEPAAAVGDQNRIIQVVIPEESTNLKDANNRQGGSRSANRSTPLGGAAWRLTGLAGVDAGLSVSAEAIWDLWQDTVAAPIDVDEACIHGDLHPTNLVVSEGRFAAVLDWGDMTAGIRPPAWARRACCSRSRPTPPSRPPTARSPGTRCSARGWPLHFGTMLPALGLEDDPVLAGTGRRTLERACPPAG